MKLKDIIYSIVPAEKRGRIKSSFDIVGDIAILELEEEIRPYMQQIAQQLLAAHKPIAVVVRKASQHEGELRIQTYEWLAGENRTETIAKENGIELFLDINKTYYSIRSQNERLRIARLVDTEERIAVLFSGVGPYTILLAKHTPAREVIGIELNKDASAYEQKNIHRNKLTNAHSFTGDARVLLPTLGLFTRIIMPLPHTAEEFLDIAYSATTEQATIHLYCFSTEEEIEEKAKHIAKTYSCTYSIHRCGSYNPAVHRYCIDLTKHR